MPQVYYVIIVTFIINKILRTRTFRLYLVCLTVTCFVHVFLGWSENILLRYMYNFSMKCIYVQYCCTDIVYSNNLLLYFMMLIQLCLVDRKYMYRVRGLARTNKYETCVNS